MQPIRLRRRALAWYVILELGWSLWRAAVFLLTQPKPQYRCHSGCLRNHLAARDDNSLLRFKFFCLNAGATHALSTRADWRRTQAATERSRLP